MNQSPLNSNVYYTFLVLCVLEIGRDSRHWVFNILFSRLHSRSVGIEIGIVILSTEIVIFRKMRLAYRLSRYILWQTDGSSTCVYLIFCHFDKTFLKNSYGNKHIQFSNNLFFCFIFQ